MCNSTEELAATGLGPFEVVLPNQQLPTAGACIHRMRYMSSSHIVVSIVDGPFGDARLSETKLAL